MIALIRKGLCMVMLFSTGTLQKKVYAAAGSLPDAFVYITSVVPAIQLDLRYKGSNNFLGVPVDGYKKAVGIISAQAAEGLKKAQELFEKDGYSIVVYDAYRPQKAVDHFVRWSKKLSDLVMKRSFYATLEKKNLFKLDYIAKKSGHSRGSTVDLTIIKKGERLTQPIKVTRTDAQGVVWELLVDNTVDMGSPFDVFHEISHSVGEGIASVHQEMRDYLRKVMDQAGFKHYDKEWWHFTLRDEPFPDTYFDFDVE